MTPAIYYILIALGSFLAMEAVAWLAHKYLMHGLLWNLHADHHHKEQYGVLEHNDAFFLIFATPGIACLALGIYTSATYALYIGKEDGECFGMLWVPLKYFRDKKNNTQ
jgi:beta-carotene 3-hydroxylase